MKLSEALSQKVKENIFERITFENRQAELRKICGNKEIADQIAEIAAKNDSLYFEVKSTLLRGYITPDRVLSILKAAKI